MCFVFFNHPATNEIYTYCHTLSLPDALPIFGIGWDLNSSSGARLLYAPGAAVVQSTVVQDESGSYDVVLLGGGSAPVVGQSLAGLRRSGSVTDAADVRSEEHTSELQSLMRISYAVFCLKKNISYTTLI